MGFPRQEYWSGLPFPSPGDLPHPGIEPVSPALAGGFFTTEPSGKPHSSGYVAPIKKHMCKAASYTIQRNNVKVLTLTCIILYTEIHRKTKKIRCVKLKRIKRLMLHTQNVCKFSVNISFNFQVQSWQFCFINGDSMCNV